MSQLNYYRSPAVARPGEIADQRPRTVLSRVSKAAVPYGFLVSQDSTIPTTANPIPGLGGGNPSADGCKLPAVSTDITTASNVLGIAVETLSIESVPRVSMKNLVQVIGSQALPTAGVFQLEFGKQQTANIAYNASAATIQAAILALSNVGTGNVSVSGPATGLAAGPVVVTFQGILAGSAVSLMSVPVSNNTMTDTNGYVVNPQVIEQVPYTDLPVYPVGHQINVLQKGAAWVTVEEDVTPASTVYVRYTANSSDYPQSGPGAFRASSDSGKAAVLASARYMTSGVAGGLALLEIDA